MVASYHGQRVDLDEAAHLIKYRPIATESLPNGFSLHEVYVLRMPCCVCVQVIYQRKNAGFISVFEHSDDQPIWFGKRPMITAKCGGTLTSIVQIDGELAASWKCGKRHITVVGVGDIRELWELVAWFEMHVA